MNARFARRVLPVAVLLVLAGTPALPSALASPADRFRPASPNPLAQPGDGDSLSSPADFEAAAADHPLPGNLAYVSRCRFAPFTSSDVYAPFTTATVADAIVGDGQVTLANNTHCAAPQNETPIAVNPANPLNVAASGNETRVDGHDVYSSVDGGRTWRNVVVSGMTGATGGIGVFAHLHTCGDPSLAFAPDGTLFYAGLLCTFPGRRPQALGLTSGVAVSRSTDGGATWGPPHMVVYTSGSPYFYDKEWVATGPDGRVYVTWTRFKFLPPSGYVESPIFLSTSSDGGATWTVPRQVSDDQHPDNQGSVPRVGADGTIYVAYEASTPSSGYLADAIVVSRSSDGGRSFRTAELARVFDDANCYPVNVSQGRPTLTGEQFRVNSFPSFALDRSTGRMAVTWADDQANPGCGYEKGGPFQGATSNEVKLITSSDGTRWSTPRVLTGDAADKVFPAVSIAAGTVTVSYYTRSYSPSTDLCQALQMDLDTGEFVLLPGAVCMDYASRRSVDDFATETRLTTESSNPYNIFAGGFIGDYTGADAGPSGAAYAAWTDFRGNPGITPPNQDAVVARSPGG